MKRQKRQSIVEEEAEKISIQEDKIERRNDAFLHLVAFPMIMMSFVLLLRRDLREQLFEFGRRTGERKDALKAENEQKLQQAALDQALQNIFPKDER